MANPFIPHRNQTAEASLQRSFEQSVHQLTQLTKRLMAWQPQPRDMPFPTPDLREMAHPPDIPLDEPPDAVKAELQSRTVAAVAAVLTEAYGEEGHYQAQGYTIQRSPPMDGTTSFRVVDSWQVVLAFDRNDDGGISIQENQLSGEQTQDFLRVAQRITEDGFEPLEADTTGQLRSEVLGALAPAGRVAQTVQQFKEKEQPSVSAGSGASITALDLVQWRYASIVLGRDKQQVNRITGLAQAAGKVSGQSFLTLYRTDREAALPLQPSPQDLPQMRRDIQQLKDLVWQVGPQQVEQLYRTQRQLDQPVAIWGNEQVVGGSSQPRATQPEVRAHDAQPER